MQKRKCEYDIFGSFESKRSLITQVLLRASMPRLGSGDVGELNWLRMHFRRLVEGEVRDEE